MPFTGAAGNVLIWLESYDKTERRK